MPAISKPPRALPARFRRTRLLIVGCGDVGLRVCRDRCSAHVQVMALTSSPDRVTQLRARGVLPLVGDLDQARSLRRLSGLAHRVLHLAPPAGDVGGDPRTARLMRVLAQGVAPRSLVYASTSGVYGDCGGAWVDETRRLAPQTARAQRRVAAERLVRHYARQRYTASILRIPGIYAPDREGGTPRARLLKGTPVLCTQDDVYTNHIHADDLARAAWMALWRGRAQRVYNTNDHTQLRMGDYFDAAADLYGLPRPERISRAQAQAQLPGTLMSFMNESRRMDNRRLLQELRITLHHPTVHEGLRETGGP